MKAHTVKFFVESGKVFKSLSKQCATLVCSIPRTVKLVLQVCGMSYQRSKPSAEEIEFVCTLRHRNIVQFYGAGRFPDGRSFLVRSERCFCVLMFYRWPSTVLVAAFVTFLTMTLSGRMIQKCCLTNE